ncbi:hypothetical protein [Paenibacillus chibensis]|uniref:hypothetical protein n=1 Tax=Paenibacillus chibensis TaxID=59846 RepID=UPI000FDB4B8B|nr:hypothetical protein [Paenibacillus chibensis]MEC0370867.1 hypothetical protein [Paenibacillus chibensis]
MAENQYASWFRTEFRELEEQGKSGDELRLAMFQKGFFIMQDVMNSDFPSWTEKRKSIYDVMKMIEYSQGWVR